MHPAALAQLDAFRAYPRPAALLTGLRAATSPAEISRAIVSAARPGFPRLPSAIREEAAADLGLSRADLDFRALYPGLDIGLYACSHSMGVPSIAGPAAVIDQLHQLASMGIEVWETGLWVEVMEQYRQRCADLVGGNLTDGDVCWFPNVSEALCATLEGFSGGSVLFTSGHFTTGHYAHHQWSQNTGGKLIEVPTDPDGSVPTDRLIDAITPDTAVISISHALFESGWLQDLPAIAAAARARAPDALVLVDAYQTAGTVPIRAASLGDNVAVAAGGHKQLRASAGAAFLYLPRRWMHLRSRRSGWWQHAAPFAFEKGPVRLADDATRLRTGTPTLIGQAMLLGELAALASSANGDLQAAVDRARRTTSSLVARLLDQCAAHRLPVRGAWGADRRAAFVCVQVPDRAAFERANARGVIADFRPVGNGGIVRLSGNAASFTYEIDAAVEVLAEEVAR